MVLVNPAFWGHRRQGMEEGAEVEVTGRKGHMAGGEREMS
jgi:hypothetical protein